MKVLIRTEDEAQGKPFTTIDGPEDIGGLLAHIEKSGGIYVTELSGMAKKISYQYVYDETGGYIEIVIHLPALSQ